MSALFSREDLMERGMADGGQAETTQAVTYASEHASPTTTSSPMQVQKPTRSFFGMQNCWSKKQRVETHPAKERMVIVIRSLHACPRGYPRLAAFLDSDRNFELFRRFGFLQKRLLLYKQDELRMLEQDLDRLDRQHVCDDPTLLSSRMRDDVISGKRKELVAQIGVKYQEYGQHYRQYRRKYYASLKLTNYFFGLRAALHLKSDPGNRILYSHRRIDVMVTVVVLMIMSLLLVVPVYVLWHLSQGTATNSSTSVTIIVLLIFTLVFSTILLKFTKAQRHEILAAAAAYCAVLVVFIGNVKQIST
ncbi:uncharacterized protein PAC_20072 [Phialocephala subalpina]|uniref:DUF6594 domain-containing protein n=1 Tax=Phialocephala subalpina TaxID=576137 RepID=A0A1L7XYM6_9HELO|nr:uncharacterized protein PAC_20072 [Phialocephala subalpina]